jgi:hypothetical protein
MLDGAVCPCNLARQARTGGRAVCSARYEDMPSSESARPAPAQLTSWGGAIWSQAEDFLTGDQTESSAFLRWSIEAVYRLEDTDAADAICDGGGDKGIDAIIVDETTEELIVLQSKWCHS